MNTNTDRIYPHVASQIQVLPRAEMAYEYLRKELLEGPLRPGDKLSVVTLCEQLSCSRVPVMEAIKRLATDGLVEIIPQVGCHVATPDLAEVEDFFKLFAAVESTIAALAATRRTSADISKFRTLCADIDNKLNHAGGPHDNDPLYRQLNLQLHSAIHQMARSPVSTKYAVALWDKSDFYIKIAFGSLYFSNFVKRSQRSLRRAIINGDPESAKTAVVSQLHAVGERVVRSLQKRD
ncbi:MAG: GntR family transcriptional regulator [Gammaproteobacteria bacterium]